MGGVKHAVLGLVIEQPSYGYKLAQRLEDRCGSWGWQRAGVYGALDQLARERLVVSLPQNDAADTGRAGARTIYEATPQGVDYFHDWLLESCSPSPLRQDLDLKILLSRAGVFAAADRADLGTGAAVPTGARRAQAEGAVGARGCSADVG